MDTLRQDLRFTFRLLREKPALTAFTLLTLALGIGANTALFTVVNGVLLRPLPYENPGQLVRLQSKADPPFSVSLPNALDWQQQSRTLSGIAAYSSANVNLSDNGSPERAHALVATGELFDLLGVHAARGRVWNTVDENDRGVILSDALWRARYAADPAIVGREITLNGAARIVIGVMPPAFRFEDAQLFTRLAKSDENRGNFFLEAIARVNSGITIATAQKELDGIGRQLAEQYAGHGVGPLLTDLQTSIVGSARRPLFVLLGAVGFVMLLACVNVASLMLTRSDGRRRELAVRSALGAVRRRLVRQMLTESLLTSLLGGLLGLLLAAWATDALLHFIPGAVPRAAEVSIDVRVLAFVLALSLLTGLLFGTAPALRASSFQLTSMLMEGGRGATPGITRNRARRTLVVAEIALALVPLAGAGLLLRSLDHLLAINPGFRAEHVLTASYSLPGNLYNGDMLVAQYARALNERAAALPGVQFAGIISHPPLGGDDASGSLEIEGRPAGKGVETPWARMRAASPGYFGAAGIPLLRGRAFSEFDNEKSTRVALIDDAFARRLFPGENPIGHRVIMGFDPKHPREVIGVVGSVRHSALTAALDPMIYFPFAQQPLEDAAIFLRTSRDPFALVAGLLDAARSVDAQIPLFNVRTLDQAVAASLARPRFNTLLFTIFALCALLIAAVGVYGVVSYTVAERSRELGIRVALGARPADIIRLVLGEGARLAVIGVGVGVLVALAGGRLLQSMLFQVSATDALTLVCVSVLLAVVTLTACYLPARRATRVDPVTTLNNG